MKRSQLVGLASGFALCCLVAQMASAVDASRASSQTSAAPNWANATLNDPAYGYGTALPDSSSDRNRTSAQPAWSDPAQPTFDPRFSTPLDPNFSQTPASQTPQRWRLGIYPEDTETGVVVKEIVRGSAAERAGLEVNDRIISVHGYQVGYVNGVVFDIGQEMERQADTNGWVRVLVQDNRNGRLMNLPVQLDGRSEAITGTITYRDRSALPRDAIATVELRENVRSDIRPITIARQTVTGIRAVPIQFSLDYDPTQVDNRRNYVLYASITSQGREIYSLRTPVPVLGNRPTSNLQLLVESTTSLPAGTTAPNRQEQLAQISQWFRQYLGREPRAQELYVWQAHLDRGGTLADAQLQILSTPEFYYQSNADDTEYIRRMFLLVTNRQPSQQEVTQWLNRLNYYSRLRPEVAKEFLASAAASTQVRQAGRL
ncbi:MAG: YbaY family lipoprotein [Bythopirellula sp.]|nr:YbaY family lipoprotein [Bythopirellula sp.]